MSPSLSVVIPVYGGELSLPGLLDELLQVLPKLTGQFEVILVEDGSPDNSWDVIQQLMPKHTCLRAFRLMRNYGQHNALLCGIRAAQYDVIVTMDDDLQHPPEEIHKLLDKLSEGYDVVYGVPQNEQHGLFRNLSSRVTKLALQGAMGAETARNISALRAFRTCVREAFVDYRGLSANIDVLLTWGTNRFTAIRVRHNPRTLGESRYTFRKLVTHALNMITGFTTIPLQFASLLGFAMTLFGLSLLFYIIVIRVIILNYDVPGFTFETSIITIFAGAQLFALGIIGEYLARMHFRLMDRPTYSVREEIGFGQENDAN